MSDSLPATMRAVVLHETNPRRWQIESIAVPQPAAGEALIKITASPLNPSDLMFLIGNYGVRKPLPVVPGFEAGGRVISVGEGVDDSWIGRKVACFSGAGDGTYAEYMRTPITNVLPVADHISEEAAAMMLVNPLTAVALVESAVKLGAKAIVQTAAASALGGMIRKAARARGLGVIDVVRRAAQAADLTASGAENVLDTSNADFDRNLRDMCRALDARVAFDAVGGTTTDRILRGMPNGSHIIVYGGLEGQPVQVGVDQFIFRDKHVHGFWLSTWMRQQPDAFRAAWETVQADFDSFKSEVRARFTVDQFDEAVALYEAQMTGGKVLIVP